MRKARRASPMTEGGRGATQEPRRRVRTWEDAPARGSPVGPRPAARPGSPMTEGGRGATQEPRRRVRTWVREAGVILACSTLALGCSGGGGSRGAGAVAAPVTAAAPGARDPMGYGWTVAPVSSDHDGALAALAPVGTAVLALESPTRRALRVDPLSGVNTEEAVLPFDVATLVRLDDGRLLAATADAGVPGAGGVQVRDLSGAWSETLGGPVRGVGRAAAVGLVNDRPHAVVDEPGVGAAVHVLTAQGWLRSGTIPSAGPPSAVGAFGITAWVGAEGAAGQPAGLWRRLGADWEQVVLPLAAPSRPDVRQRVTALVPLPTRLIIAVGAFDLTTGKAEAGALLAWDDAGISLLEPLPGDAPLAVVRHEETVFVGTAMGRLQYLDPITGTFVDEPGVPTTGAVRSLLPLDASTLLLGVTEAGRGVLVRRVGLSAAGTPLPTPSGNGAGVAPVGSSAAAGVTSGAVAAGPTFLTDVAPILVASCASCHVRIAGFRLSANGADPAADHAAVMTELDLATPAASLLLRKAANEEPHRGGKVLAPASPEFATLLAWVRAGAPFGAGQVAAPPVQTIPVVVTPPVIAPVTTRTTPGSTLPGSTAPVATSTPVVVTPPVIAPVTTAVVVTPPVIAPVTTAVVTPPVIAPVTTAVVTPTPPATYLADVKPLLQASCAGCHVTRSRMRLSAGLADDAADYAAVLLRVDLASPDASALLVRPSDPAARHPLQVFDVGSPEYTALRGWITGGAPFDRPPVQTAP
jgi:hypothetical protein